MNCGNSAVKNRMDFGFDACKINPSPNIRSGGFSIGAPAASALRFPESVRTPRKIRYAAPIHLTVENRSKDVANSTPRLVADRTKYTRFAARIPAVDARPFRAPDFNALESTNSTAGPGVRHSTVSVTANNHQVVQFIVEALTI